MDSIFEYLIILFFIFSILQGIFSKKKKEAGKKQPPQNMEKRPSPIDRRDENQKTAKTEKEKDASEILGEIFGIPLPKPEDKTKSPAPVNRQQNYRTESKSDETWDPAEEFGIKEEKPKIFETAQKKYEKEKEDIYKRLEKTPKIELPKLEKKIEVASSKARRIKDQLKNKHSIRDLIIAQEILNKPIALRD